jgi:hypothetical protein
MRCDGVFTSYKAENPENNEFETVLGKNKTR